MLLLLLTNNSKGNIRSKRKTTKTRKQKWEEKNVCMFQAQTVKIADEITWAWLRRGNLKRKTESLLIAAQNNAVRTNYIAVKIDHTQPNSECRLCRDKDETVNHIQSDRSKLVRKEYKSRDDWVGKVIY